MKLEYGDIETILQLIIVQVTSILLLRYTARHFTLHGLHFPLHILNFTPNALYPSS